MPADGPTGVRHEGGVTSRQASVRNPGTCRPDAKGETQAVSHREGLSTDAGHRGGDVRSRVDGSVTGPDQRDIVIRLYPVGNPIGEDLHSAGSEKSTSMPNPSRLKSSKTFNSRNCLPSSKRSAMKSIDQTRFGASGTVKASGLSRFKRLRGLILRFNFSSRWMRYTRLSSCLMTF
jgi:hypothetical protein